MRLRNRLAMTAASTLTAVAGLGVYGVSSSSATGTTAAPTIRTTTTAARLMSARTTSVVAVAGESTSSFDTAQVASVLKACGITLNSAAPVSVASAA